jgi:hypothetical protein
MNMNLQARSTRPSATARESKQATTLLNWQLFSHLQAEWHFESELAIVWSAALGSSVMAVDWCQERRLEYIDVGVPELAQILGKMVGQPVDLLVLQDMLTDPAGEKELAQLIQQISPIISTSQAKSILRDFRDLRHAEIPVPYTFRSSPSFTTLRPMIDVFFNPEASDLQRERWIDRVEYVTESILTDRIETEGYDPEFVSKALETRGQSPGFVTGRAGVGMFSRGYNVVTPGNKSAEEKGQLIELHHFYHYALDMGVPCLYRTVFHSDVDIYATHGLCEYKHGQMPFHAFRMETDDRPILSSMGIPENVATWENELKVQFDSRTDRASLALKPPLFSDHADVLKMKAGYMPSTIIPIRRGTEPRLAQIPQYDPGSIQVSQDIMARFADYYGWFGAQVDPSLKQMRQMELADRTLTQFKPVFQQMFKLDRQYLPDAEVAAIVGPLARPFQIDRADIQAEHEITATCDPRNLDNDFLKASNEALSQILPWDTMGIIDRSVVVRNRMEAIDYNLADQAIRSPEAASHKEVTSEIDDISKIVGSGIEQPLPGEGSNFGLRLQTLQNTLQQSPYTMQRLRQAPDVTKAIENRILYYQRQIQQQQNASIGKIQVGSATNPLQAPMMAGPAALQGGQ